MTESAVVETLVAEVRTLMVGKRQVTLSVYKQLDMIPPREIIPFGRVSAGTYSKDQYGYKEYPAIELVGSDACGQLVRSNVYSCSFPPEDPPRRMDVPVGDYDRVYGEWEKIRDEWRELCLQFLDLPKIVLAGLGLK